MVVGTLGDAAMGPLIGALDGLKGQIKAAMAFADNAQKASLALGQTYEQTRDSLGSTMEGLRGDINQRFGAAIAGMEAGLQGNTAGVAKLINQQQLTGTAYQATAKAFASLEAGMNLSRDDTNALSDSLIETGAEWGVSTDKLVQAIDALKATFPAQKLAGMGKEVMQAVTQLQGELGPSLAGPLQSVMTMVMDTSEEGFAKLTKLGLGGVREQIAAAKSSEEVQSILKDAFVTASETFKMHTAGSDQFFRKIGVATENLGQGAIDFTTVADAFGDRQRQEIDQSADFGMTLANLKAEILVPFQEALAKFYPIIIKSFDALSLVARRVVERFSKFLESTLPGADKAFKVVTLKIIDFAILGLNTFDKFRKKVAIVMEDLMPKIKNAFLSVDEAIHFGIIVPFELVKITFTAFMNGLDTIYGAFLLIVKGLAEAINAIPFTDMDDAIAGIDRQLASVGDRMLDRADAMSDSIDRITTSPKESAEEFSRKLKEANEDPDLLGNKLLSDLRDDFAEGNKLQRETAKNTEEINDKTPDRVDTASEFLGETATMLSESIENILGIGADTTTADMLEELRIANAQRAAQEPVVISSKTENNADG
jgi:hypothetical protein